MILINLSWEFNIVNFI